MQNFASEDLNLQPRNLFLYIILFMYFWVLRVFRCCLQGLSLVAVL